MSAVELVNPGINIKQLREFEKRKDIKFYDSFFLKNLELNSNFNNFMEAAVIDPNFYLLDNFKSARSRIVAHVHSQWRDIEGYFNLETDKITLGEDETIKNITNAKILNPNFEPPDFFQRLFAAKINKIKEKNETSNHNFIDDGFYLDYLVKYKMLSPNENISDYLKVIDDTRLNIYKSLPFIQKLDPHFDSCRALQKLGILKILLPEKINFTDFEKSTWFKDGINFIDDLDSGKEEKWDDMKLIILSNFKLMLASDVNINETGVKLTMHDESFLPMVKSQRLPLERSFA